MLDLMTKADLQRLVDEGLEESLTLDYKASPALSREGKSPDEMCKDVTALANSAGGQLVYGIEENKVTKKPSGVDDGVADPKITREWIEQILNSRVQPRLNGVQTTRIDMENGRYGYVIAVPQSQVGPHQAPDQKYYRRFDLQSVPMHDYEIKDVMRRATTPDLYAELRFQHGNTTQLEYVGASDLSQPSGITIVIHNRSNQPAEYTNVEFGYDSSLVLARADDFLDLGITTEPDGHRLRFARKLITVQNNGLIFRELPTIAGALHYKFHNHIPNDKHLLRCRIYTPGFKGQQDFELKRSGTRLELREL